MGISGYRVGVWRESDRRFCQKTAKTTAPTPTPKMPIPVASAVTVSGGQPVSSEPEPSEDPSLPYRSKRYFSSRPPPVSPSPPPLPPSVTSSPAVSAGRRIHFSALALHTRVSPRSASTSAPPNATGTSLSVSPSSSGDATDGPTTREYRYLRTPHHVKAGTDGSQYPSARSPALFDGFAEARDPAVQWELLLPARLEPAEFNG